MSAEDFIDTNVFIYHLDASDSRKQAIAERIIRQALTGGNACISYQVIQEFLNVSTRKFAQPLTAPEAKRYLDTALAPLCEVFPSVALYGEALGISSRWGLSFYDSLIVAGAAEAGCELLLTEDLQDGQRIRDLQIVNPFAHPELMP